MTTPRRAPSAAGVAAALVLGILVATIGGAFGALPMPRTAAAESVAPAQAATEHTVTIEGFQFRPALASVKAGDTVIWRNADLVPHTVSAKDAGLDSPPVASGATFRFTATRKGRFDYICTLHPTMKATLVVE